MGQRLGSYQRTRRRTFRASGLGTHRAPGTRHFGSKLPSARSLYRNGTCAATHRPSYDIRHERGRSSICGRENAVGTRTAGILEGRCTCPLGHWENRSARRIPEALAALDERAALMAGRKLNGSRRSQPAACLPLWNDSTSSTNLVLSSSTAGGSRAETNTASS